MKSVPGIRFMDVKTSEETWAYVHYGDTWVVFSLFDRLREVESMMERETAKALLDALRSAIAGATDLNRASQPPTIEEEQPALKEVANIRFADAQTAKDSSVIVLYGRAFVTIHLYNEDDWHIDVAMGLQDARALQEALETAVRG